MIAIICSKKDPAGMNIRQQLLSLFAFRQTDEHYDDEVVYSFDAKGKDIRLFTVEEHSVFQEHLDERIPAELFVFATKHESANKVHSLTIHSIGNFGEAIHGGNPGELGVWPAIIMKAAFLELRHQAQIAGIDAEFDITYEATHHGPSMKKPLFFIEIGSDTSQFSRSDAGSVIAQTIMATLQKDIAPCKAVVGIGGTHYCQNFVKVVLNTDYCLGHVCPKYALDKLNLDLLQQMISKTYAEVEYVLLDWKGLGEHKTRITTLLDESKLPYRKLHEFIDDKTVP